MMRRFTLQKDHMLRVALVGCGGMARSYRRTYAALPGVEWALGVDVNEQTLADCRAEGAKRTSNRFEDALADGIDVVDISTPNHLHAEQAIAALKAGKHVLVQKPISNRLEDADRVVDAWKASGKIAGMFMSAYTNPLVWDIKRMVDAGALGTIQAIHARDAHRGGLSAKPDAWRGSREQTGGGCFTQLSVHGVNLVSFWLNDRIEEVAAWQQNTLCPNIGGDDATVAMARFVGGKLGTFTSGYASDGYERFLAGTKGWFRLMENDRIIALRLDQPYDGQIIKYTRPGELMQFEAPHPRFDDVTNPFNVHRAFLDAVRDGKRPRFTVLDGRNDLAVVQAVYDSGDRGGAVVKVNYRET